MKIGPFFYIRKELIAAVCEPSEGRLQAGKRDNSVGHDELYEKHFRRGDYIDYPRGRVIWDVERNRAIVYIDPCIYREEVISEIVRAFELKDYVVELDDHYHCKNCIGQLWDEL